MSPHQPNGAPKMPRDQRCILFQMLALKCLFRPIPPISCCLTWHLVWTSPRGQTFGAQKGAGDSSDCGRGHVSRCSRVRGAIVPCLSPLWSATCEHAQCAIQFSLLPPVAYLTIHPYRCIHPSPNPRDVSCLARLGPWSQALPPPDRPSGSQIRHQGLQSCRCLIGQKSDNAFSNVSHSLGGHYGSFLTVV